MNIETFERLLAKAEVAYAESKKTENDFTLILKSEEAKLLIDVLRDTLDAVENYEN